jgi:hypothetical protein
MIANDLNASFGGGVASTFADDRDVDERNELAVVIHFLEPVSP